MPERFVPKAESDTSQPVPGMTWEQVWTDTQAFALAWSIVTLVWGLGVVTLVWWRRGQKLILWPEQRFYLVPWGAFQVVVLMLVGIVLSSLCTQAISWPKQWALWRFALVGVVEAVLFVWAPIRLLGIPAYQLGWNWRRWPADVALAWLIWLLASPVTMAVWMAAVWFWPAEQHTLIEELRATPSWLNALALAITAIVLAPLAEEGLFRGLIQRKMAAEPLWADLTMLIALCAAIVKGYRGTSWGPILFLVTAGPGYLAFEWMTWVLLPRPGLARAVYATSLIFAVLHANAWPAPVPLFFLSLFLGTLAARTQSLLGPLLVHAVFNATTVLAVLMQ